MISFFKKNKYFCFGFLIILLVVAVNIFPKGFVFGGGDTTQFLQAKENIKDLFFEWQGRALFFYLFFALLDFLQISNSVQLSFYLGIFLLGSYFSFYYFSRLIFPKISEKKKVFASLFYALNLYTLFNFTGNWGYSYFPSLYIFIPILTGLFLKFLRTQKNIWGVLFALFTFLGSSGFGNPAFFFSFFLFLGVLFLSLLIFKYFKLSKKLISKTILISLLLILVNLFWLLPTASEMKGGLESLQSSEVIEFNYWIKNTANPILKTLSLNHYSEKYFPYNFYYKTFDQLKPLFLSLSFLPIVIIFWGFFLKKRFSKREKLLFLAFFSTLLVFVMLVARLAEPFKVLNYYIYHLPGFVTLRGYDKTAIFIPFLTTTMLLLTISKIKSQKILFVFLALILITPLPFYIGKLQQTAGYRVSSKKNYQEAPMSFLVKIPKEYYSIREKINESDKMFFVASLPKTQTDGSGIVYYPKWNFYGGDITNRLYNKKLIYPNNPYFPNWSFTSQFNQTDKDPAWLPKLLGIMNSKYIIYHLDAPEEDVLESQSKMEFLEKNNLIKSLEKNEYFILYEINSRHFLPYITYQKEKFAWRNDSNWIDKNAEKIIEDSKEVSMTKINPKKFVIDFENSCFSKNIILSEKFNPLWKAHAIFKNGSREELQNHFLARGWTNGWQIENQEEIDHIIIEYYPTYLMWRGIWISSLTVLFLLGYLIKYYYKKKS